MYQVKNEIIELQNSRKAPVCVYGSFPSDIKKKSPFVIAVHGFDSNLHEYGLYDTLARKLAERGIACFRFDFPGCGESAEQFGAYDMTNMIEDMEMVFRYASEKEELDSSSFGIQGYSMGGRASALFTKKHPQVNAVSLWAPGISNGIELIKGFLGEKDWLENYKKAEKEGGFFVNPFGRKLFLNKRFFEEALLCNPLEYMAEYEGKLFYSYGLCDDVVDVRDVQALGLCCKKVKICQSCVFEKGGHDFGTAYGRGAQNEAIKEKVTEETAGFFAEALR